MENIELKIERVSNGYIVTDDKGVKSIYKAYEVWPAVDEWVKGKEDKPKPIHTIHVAPPSANPSTPDDDDILF